MREVHTFGVNFTHWLGIGLFCLSPISRNPNVTVPASVPMSGLPHGLRTRSQFPSPAHPDVTSSAPIVMSRNPNVFGTRRRAKLGLLWRRGGRFGWNKYLFYFARCP